MNKETKEIIELTKELERTKVLSKILKYLIKNHQITLTYDEIKKIVENMKNKGLIIKN